LKATVNHKEGARSFRNPSALADRRDYCQGFTYNHPQPGSQPYVRSLKENVPMKNLTQRSSKQFFGAAIRVVTLALFLAVFGAGAALAQTKGYVTNSIDNTVSVINTSNNTVVATIPVGANPIGIAVTPNGDFVYVGNRLANTVSVISTATDTVVDTVTVGSSPLQVAITPNGAFAYVTNNGSGTVSVIDTATHTVATFAAGSTPNGIAITPNGALAYVVNQFPLTVSVIDTATNAVVNTVPLGGVPGLELAAQIGITPNGAFAYVTGGSFSNHVWVISTATNLVVATITVATSGSLGIAITPNGAFAYVARNGDVSVIDTATNTEVAAVTVGMGPRGVAINPTGAFAYVANIGSDDVSVINTSTNLVVATILVGSFPQFIAFGPPPHGPTNIEQCKNGGWGTFTNPTFKNQGQCVSFVNHMNHTQ
jgi:YVTN family beta-propeller protein